MHMPPHRTRKTIETRLEEWEAKEDLETLVRAGCDRQEILSLLELLSSGWVNDSWKHLTGLELNALKSAVKKIRDSAKTIRELNRHRMMWAAISYGPVGCQEFYDLPKLLGLYADLIESEIACSGPKRRFWESAVKALLVDVPLRTCGRVMALGDQ